MRIVIYSSSLDTGLDKCQIYDQSLVDPLLKPTYRKLTRLPRYSTSHGIALCFFFSYSFWLGWQTMHPLGDPVPPMVVFSFPRSCPTTKTRMWSKSISFLRFIHLYNYFKCRYLKRLIAFSHDKKGNIGNLSRIDPSLLGVKDANSFIKNALYLYGHSSSPLLCFSLVLVTRDHHEGGRVLGSDPKSWVVKDVAGVLLTMELERFIAVLGLAYELPYVPDDSARREHDLLHLPMVDNAFSFSTGMMLKNGELCLHIFLPPHCLLCFITEFDNAVADGSSKSTPKSMNKRKIFAPASPAFSSKGGVLSSAARKASLRASETGMDIV